MSVNFAPITLEGQQAYHACLAQMPEKTSDYSFVNLWGWGPHYGLEWCWESGIVFLRQTVPSPVYWAPVGAWDAVDWRRVLAALPGPLHFVRVPEALVGVWRGAGIPMTVAEAREHWDYVYSVEELVSLAGRRFHSKKNLLHQFVRDHAFQLVALDERTGECALALQTDWFLWRDTENDATLAAENHAIVRVLHDWSRLEGIMGAGIAVDGKMIAYTVADPLDDTTLVIHFEKGCPQFRGVYQAINQMFLERFGQGFMWVNREQDLGDEGLRRAKLSYHPAFFMKKYTVTVAL
nr:phosphatidylglycerol lysyltransferase domain-containing protein [Thermodesulfomicrobium sp. WS]